jgi:CheY-like chemotaxis protein
MAAPVELAAATKTVLLVQDSRAVLARMASDLRANGLNRLRIIGANSEPEISAAVAEHAPDLVVVNLHLASPGAQEVVRQVREQSATRVGVAFTFVPGGEDAEDLLMADEANATFVLPLPYDPKDFADRVSLTLGLDLVRSASLSPEKPATGASAHPPEQSGPQGAARMPQAEVWRSEVAAEMRKALGGVPMVLNPQDGVQMQPPATAVVTLLSAGAEHKPWGVVVMDVAAACMIGGAVLQLPPGGVRPTIAEGSPTPQMVAAVQKFWSVCVSNPTTTWCSPATATRTAVIKSDSGLYRTLFPQAAESKIYSLLHGQNTATITCTLNMPGYGQGTIGLHWFSASA